MSKVTLEQWPIENLIPYELNAKKHEKDQVARIAASIRKSGFHQPIVVDRDGVIIAGHGRRLAAIELGLKTVPVWQRKDLWGDAARAARLADNRVALSDIDSDLLRADIVGIESDLADIFDEKELNFIGADLGEMASGVFETDMDSVLAEQTADLERRAEAVATSEARIPLGKAFGFKDVPASAQLVINKLMAKAEASTGMTGADALVAFAEAHDKE